MGYGDQLIAAGLAERLYAEDPSRGPVTITDLAGRTRWQPLWGGNPAIGVTETGPRIACGAGCLPYLVYPKQPGRLTFNPAYRAADSARARIYLTDAERSRARDYCADHEPFILVEPFPTDRKNPNRQWPLSSWQKLITLLNRQALTLVQCAHDYATRLDGVRRVWSPTFRDACAIMERSTCVVALEGGIPFATAALRIPTVVLWGGAVSADTLAYPEHCNIRGPHNGHGCLKPCAQCAASWASIDPEWVALSVINEFQLRQRKVS